MTIALLLMARLLLAGVFAVAGIAKLADLTGSRKSMRDFGIPDSLAGVFGTLLPVAELLGAVAVLPSPSAWWGAAGLMGLLLVFMGAIGFTLLRGRRPDCHCFGQLQSTPIGWSLVARNAVLACLAGVVVAPGAAAEQPSFAGWLHSLSGTETVLLALIVAFACLAVFQVWSVTELLKQNGRLMLRIEALEARGPAVPPMKPAAAPPDPGLPVNTPAPAFILKNLAGETATLPPMNEPGKPALLFFMEPGCGSCDAILPEVARWQNDHAERLTVIPIGTGDVKANGAKAEKAGVHGVLVQANAEAMKAYRVAGTPGAVLVKNGLIAAPVALGADAISRLVAHSALPSAVSRGDTVPALKLPDLDGRSFDMASIRKRTLLLFWNPGCGYCQRMLADLKAWETSRPAGAPELLVMSAGSAEEIRKQGLSARVLLDPYFAASGVFQSGGTPSAVLIGEDGRLASDVGVGAEDVMRLAGALHAAILRQ